MSRSYRHTPIFGITLAKSEKKDKRIANRCLRRTAKIALNRDDEIIPTIRDVSDVYNFDKDGKLWGGSWEDGKEWKRKAQRK